MKKLYDHIFLLILIVYMKSWISIILIFLYSALEVPFLGFVAKSVTFPNCKHFSPDFRSLFISCGRGMSASYFLEQVPLKKVVVPSQKISHYKDDRRDCSRNITCSPPTSDGISYSYLGTTPGLWVPEIWVFKATNIKYGKN